MKTIFFLLLLHAIPAYSNQFGLRCATPTTIVDLRTDGDFLVGKIFHPHGTKFTPFYKGTITSFQVPEVAEMAKIHRLLFDSQETIWPLEKCKIKVPYLISCQNGKFQDSSKTDMTALYLETSLMQQDFVNASYESLNFSMTLKVNGQIHKITSDYSVKSHCQRLK